MLTVPGTEGARLYLPNTEDSAIGRLVSGCQFLF